MTLPAVTHVCRQMRNESLDIYYGCTEISLELGNCRHLQRSDHSKRTPHTAKQIFQRWIGTMGDENAARIRHISFYCWHVVLNIKLYREHQPFLTLRERKAATVPDVVKRPGPRFSIASVTGTCGTRRDRTLPLDGIEGPEGRGLATVADLATICSEGRKALDCCAEQDDEKKPTLA